MDSGGGTRSLIARVLLLGATTLWSTGASAQSTSLTVSPSSVLLPAPKLSNYLNVPAGATTPVTDSVSIGYTALQVNDSYKRDVAIKLRCVVITGGKACTDLQWRSQATSTWQDITTFDTTIDTRRIGNGVPHDSFSGTVWLRMKLSWTSDAPATYAATVAMTMDVTR